MILVGPVLSGHLFGDSVQPHGDHDSVIHGAAAMLSHAWNSIPLWLALAGLFFAWVLYVRKPSIPGRIVNSFGWVHQLFLRKYWIDEFYERAFVKGSQLLGRYFWQYSDRWIIDDGLVNGSARLVGRISSIVRSLQTGYVYHYAFSMILGLVALISWFLWI
jgi:NADH-quinone oxidoreductase subunit L